MYSLLFPAAVGRMIVTTGSYHLIAFFSFEPEELHRVMMECRRVQTGDIPDTADRRHGWPGRDETSG